MVVYEASPALFAMPGVHQNVFLRVVADYTYACFIHVIVSLSCELSTWNKQPGPILTTRYRPGQAIYPVLIIVIVALNWSPIDHLTGIATVDDGNVGSSTNLNFRAATSAMTTDTTLTRYSRSGEDEALRMEINQASSSV